MIKFLYDTLRLDPGLVAFHQGRVYQTESLMTRNHNKPYLVYALGNDTAEDLSEDTDISRQFFTIYIHDEGADYTRINNMVRATILALKNKTSKADHIVIIRYLETSADMDDETLGTIMRYVRFQAVRSDHG